MIKNFLLSILLLSSLAFAAELNNTQYGNFSFTFTNNQVLGEKMSIGVYSNNTGNTEGFSCKTIVTKGNTPILNDYQISNIKGFSQNQLDINIPIDDRFQLYNRYNVTSNCVTNENFEKQTINFVAYIEPSSSFNLFLNFQLWAKNNGTMVLIGIIVLLFVLGSFLVFIW